MLESCDRNDLCYGGWKQSSFTNTNQLLVLVSLCKAKIRSYDANLVLLLWSISPHAYAHVINFLKIGSKSDKNGSTKIILGKWFFFKWYQVFFLCEMARKLFVSFVAVLVKQHV